METSILLITINIGHGGRLLHLDLGSPVVYSSGGPVPGTDFNLQSYCQYGSQYYYYYINIINYQSYYIYINNKYITF